MKIKEALKKEIVIYWWNLGTKTLDFKGTYEDYFKKIGIKMSNISFPKDKKIKGIRYMFPTNTTTFRIDDFNTEFTDGFNIVIKTYLSYLGDKAIFKDFYGRKYEMNWR